MVFHRRWFYIIEIKFDTSITVTHMIPNIQNSVTHSPTFFILIALQKTHLCFNTSKHPLRMWLHLKSIIARLLSISFLDFLGYSICQAGSLLYLNNTYMYIMLNRWINWKSNTTNKHWLIFIYYWLCLPNWW